MSKVLFELNFGVVNNIEEVTDYLTEIFSNYMLKIIGQSVSSLDKNFNSTNIGMYSLSEFISDCNDLQKKILIYKFLLERLYPVIVDRNVVYICELECFRPGYIAYTDAQEFTKILNESIREILQNSQIFLKNKGLGVPKEVRLDVRYILNLIGISQIGIRDLDSSEQKILEVEVVNDK